MIFRNDKLKRYFSLFTVIIFCNLNFNCAYYRVRSGKVGPDTSIRTIKRHNFRTNYYVVHVGDSMWRIENFKLEANSIKGKLSPFEGESLEMYNRMIRDGSKRVTMRDSEYAYQIHVYADGFEKDGELVSISETDLTRIDIFDINQAVRVVSTVGTGLLISSAGFALLLAIACACPHVYVYNGETYELDNSLFTGAVAPQLERSDFKLLPDYFKTSDKYKFYIKNDEQEKQFTNLLNLLVVTHEEGSQVYPDQQGHIRLVKDPILPRSVMDDGERDLSELVNYEDGRAFVFNNSTADDFSHVYATFNSPVNKEDAKLVLQLKNSEWAGYVYSEFGKLFGSYYDNWVKRNQRKKSTDEMNADQKRHGLPLVISVKSSGEWVDIETVNLMGTLSYNGLVVNIPSELLTNDDLEVRIRSGFMFWKLDYLALDCSENQNLDVQILQPALAQGSDGSSFISELIGDDQLYMEHQLIGDSTYIEFQGLKVDDEKERTLILQSKGYYLPLTKYETKMDRKELARFKADGEMSRFSKELYEESFGNLTVVFE